MSSKEDIGFVSFQIRLRDVAFTISRLTMDELDEDMVALGFDHNQIVEVKAKLRNALLTTEVETKAGERGVETAKKGFPAKQSTEYGPNCGHGVPTKKQKKGAQFFWTCQAQDEKGTFLWKKGEGCKWVEVD